MKWTRKGQESFREIKICKERSVMGTRSLWSARWRCSEQGKAVSFFLSIHPTPELTGDGEHPNYPLQRMKVRELGEDRLPLPVPLPAFPRGWHGGNKRITGSTCLRSAMLSSPRVTRFISWPVSDTALRTSCPSQTHPKINPDTPGIGSFLGSEICSLKPQTDCRYSDRWLPSDRCHYEEWPWR